MQLQPNLIQRNVSDRGVRTEERVGQFDSVGRLSMRSVNVESCMNTQED